MQVNIQSMQWSRLQFVADVKPIDDSDAPVLEAIRSILEQHNCLDRFGITLLHNHFDIDDDEIMMEFTDLEKREHRVSPMKRADLEQEGIDILTTVVGFDKNGYFQGCGCNPKASGHHHL